MSEYPDYKHTLQLPNTDFPMKANLAQKELEILDFWTQENIYEQICLKNQGRPVFVLNDGPPYANGDIHIGHALNKILKDIIVKSKNFSGFQAPFIPGWDCHGLPIELNVEKQRGKITEQFDATAFKKACRQHATEQVEKQRQSFIRLGVFGDWQNPYLTMSPQFEADTVRAFASILNNGHVHSGRKPVHWCIACGSALAEAEIEYADKTSPAIDVGFEVIGSPSFQPFMGSFVLIWTTTPWTLPANRAVAVNPAEQYVQVQVQDEKTGAIKRYILALELLPTSATRYGWQDYSILTQCLGKDLLDLSLQHPFLDRSVPIVLGDHVTLDAGTGCVHTAPAHGQEDYELGKMQGLEVDNPVNEKGVFFESVPFVGGKSISEANTVILDLLRQQDRLVASALIQHSYPHCWRHKIPLIFRATLQWFVNMDLMGLREQTLKILPQIEWLPHWGLARMQNMLVKRPDWCISRQRTWGVPLGLAIHKETGALHPRMAEILESLASKIETHGIEIWSEWAKDFEEHPAWNPDRSHQLIPDVLDVWFESGVVHEAVLKKHPALKWPADLYIEGSDQYRGWFQTSLLTAIAIQGQAPYKTVLTHGYTVDAQGHKMSKSLGNVIAPDKVIKTLGADVLRLWVASTDYRGGDISVSEEILKRTTESYRRIRNTLRFLLANLHDFDPNHRAHCLEPKQLLSLDLWILKKASHLQKQIIQAYEAYDFHTVVGLIQQFSIVDLGGFYLDIIKDRQYTGKTNGIPRRSAQTVMHHILRSLLPLIAPVLSFTAEEAWGHVRSSHSDSQHNSIFLSEWHAFPTLNDISDGLEEHWEAVLKTRDLVNKALEEARVAKTIGGSLEAKVIVETPSSWYKKLLPFEKELKFVWISSDAQLKENTALNDLQDIRITIESTTDPKCLRCWHRVPDVNHNPDHPGICHRCVQNICDEQGEARLYA